MQPNFMNSVEVDVPNRNRFDLNHSHAFSMNIGTIIPALIMEVVPGDTIRIDPTIFTRFLPLGVPIMSRLDFKMEAFFVPERLLWKNFPDWIAPGFNTPPVRPFVILDNVGVGSIADYMGIKPQAYSTPIKVLAAPFAAYGMVHNEFYRDEDLMPDVDYTLSDGDNTTALTTAGVLTSNPFYRCWEKDLFTSARPWTQKGNPVTIPLGSTAPLVNDPIISTRVRPVTGGNPAAGPVAGDAAVPVLYDDNGIALNFDVTSHTVVDLQNATAATVNDWRTAIRIQEFLERDAVGGTRYNEYIYAHYHVRTKDASIQRPQLIGTLKSPVKISEVLQTSETAASPLATQGGHAIMAAEPVEVFTHYADEFGFIIVMCSVMPKTMYADGLQRMWTKLTSRYELLNPILSHLGEQAIRNDEVWLQTNNPAGNLARSAPFGYNRRFYEYCQMQSRVSGLLRPGQNLDIWTTVREFASAPVLNDEFVTVAPDEAAVTRIFVDTSDADKLICVIYYDMDGVRPAPKYGKPGI